MASRERKPRLKDTDPVKYYKRRKRVLSVCRAVCNLFPAITVLTVYGVASTMGKSFTNPLVPWRFTVGMVLIVIATVWAVAYELRSVSKNSKADGGTGIDFGGAVAWLIVATVLWLFYMTTFYLIIFACAEFIGSFFGSFCTYGVKQANEMARKNGDAEIQAKAIVREQKKAFEAPVPKEPTE